MKKLCVRALRRELTAVEKEAFEGWLGAGPENRAYYESLRSVWSGSAYPVLDDIDVESRWIEFESRYDLDETKRPERPPVRVRPARTVFRFGGSKWMPATGFAFALVLITMIGIQQHWFRQPRVIRMQAFTQNAETMQVALEDGTIVHLNHASRIEYLQPFSDTLRCVKLQGEAFFEVSKGKVPFEVITDQASVRVLGTRFNVWSRQSRTRLMVTEGLVRFSGEARSAKPVLVERGQLSQVTARSGPEAARDFPMDSSSVTPAWMRGLLEFVRMPMEEIVCELGCYYDTQIEIRDPVLAKRSVTASYQNEPLETVLKSLALTLHMRVEKTGNGYVLSPGDESRKRP
ncbi:FecR domain-containing protein [bacterium]|nr:FecR domain-containing protein [bacterium]